jgi:radical SAM superfamily enzyme YgiQ (UPF0313 family)
MDAIIINPGGRDKTYQSLNNGLTAIEPPIWAGLITSFLLKRKYTVDILDTNGLFLNAKQTADKVKELKPKIVAIIVYGHNPSASTQTMPASRELIKEIKSVAPDTEIVLIGGHVASLPVKTLTEEESDFICTGEGPYTLEDLIKYKDGKLELNEVRSLAYRLNGRVVQTTGAPLIQDLDNELPGLPWHLLPMDNYRCHNWHAFGEESRLNYASIYTTLGCPFTCSFCCIQAPFKEGEELDNISKNTYRKWSPEFILNQIDTLVRDYGVKHIKFADEIFVLDRKHVEEICQGLISRNYDINIWAYSRVDTITDRTAKLFRDAGIKWICLGIESVNEASQKSVNKSIQGTKIDQAIKILKDNGINIIGNFIFGLPEDNLDSMQETLEQAIEMDLDFANFYCTMPYPGSDLYKQAVKSNLQLPDNWQGYSQHSYNTRPLPTNYISGEEVLKFRDNAFHYYFSNERYLNYIETKFGKETREHIVDMSSTRLKRKYVNE